MKGNIPAAARNLGAKLEEENNVNESQESKVSAQLDAKEKRRQQRKYDFKTCQKICYGFDFVYKCGSSFEYI